MFATRIPRRTALHFGLRPPRPRYRPEPGRHNRYSAV